jgi:superfamily I DNA/RNA helicase
VLYRSNLQARPFEVALRGAGIPYVVVGGQEFFERAEVKDIVAYLKVIANPRDEAALLRIVNVPRRGIGHTTMHQALELAHRERLSVPKALAGLLDRGGLAQNTEAGIRRFLGLLSDFRKRFRAGADSLTGLCQDLLDTIGYRDDLLRTCKSPAQFEARWSNVQTLVKAVMDYEAAGPAPTLSGFLDQSALVTDDDRRAREDRRRDGVTLMTVHSAKGLEFPFVFVAGLEEGLFPHEKSLNDAALEEERRLFYVALTRAQRHVTLFDCCARERYGKRRVSRPSRFLQEIPPELLQPRIRAARDMVADSAEPGGERVDGEPAPVKLRRRRSKQK